MNIIKSSTPMNKKPMHNAILETECLYGETVEILEEKIDWVYCRLMTDNYHGWVKKNDLGILPEPTHKVNAIRTFVYESNDPKSLCIKYLPMESKLTVEKIVDNWAIVSISFHNKIITRYLPRQDIVPLDYKFKNWVQNAEKLLNIPYKWGGRDTFGIDCSALIQISYATSGKNIPRNSVDQMNIGKKIITNDYDIDRGVVIFWEGHVALMVDKLNCIHANAYSMKTNIEPLSEIISRMGSDSEIKKMMNFN